MVAAASSQRTRVWHVLVLGISVAGCAPTQGWRRQQHVCPSDAPARVCLQARPDQAVSMTVGGATLVPGECADAPKGGRGSLKVELHDPPGVPRAHRVWVRPGTRTIIELDAAGDVQRQRKVCDATAAR